MTISSMAIAAVLASAGGAPKVVDNSKDPAFPPIARQIGNCCSQKAAGYYILGYNFNQQRGTDAKVAANQIAAYHSWNFINSGKDYGSEFGDSWAIAKYMGLPSVADYGDQTKMSVGRWMSGYDKYYRAMKNRTESWHYVDVTTPEGLRQAKRWLWNRGKEGGKGGLLAADFQMHDIKLATIAKGQPEAGKKIIRRWGRTKGGHLMTYVGYDDRVGFDFNNDGKITNHIDINNDGKVDMADWERGCFILANSWGKKWANNGLVYAPYREHVLSGWDRGKWVGIVKVKQDYQPRVALRLKMQCANRSALSLRWGKSGLDQDEKTVRYVDSPLFRRSVLETRSQPKSPEKFVQYAEPRYKLGKHPLRGPGDAKPLEIGFDLTGLLYNWEKAKGKRFNLKVVVDGKAGEYPTSVHEAELIFYDAKGQVQKRVTVLDVRRDVEGSLTLKKPLHVEAASASRAPE